MDLRGVATPGTHSPTLDFARAGGPPCRTAHRHRPPPRLHQPYRHRADDPVPGLLRGAHDHGVRLEFVRRLHQAAVGVAAEGVELPAHIEYPPALLGRLPDLRHEVLGDLVGRVGDRRPEGRAPGQHRLHVHDGEQGALAPGQATGVRRRAERGVGAVHADHDDLGPVRAPLELVRMLFRHGCEAIGNRRSALSRAALRTAKDTTGRTGPPGPGFLSRTPEGLAARFGPRPAPPQRTQRPHGAGCPSSGVDRGGSCSSPLGTDWRPCTAPTRSTSPRGTPASSAPATPAPTPASAWPSGTAEGRVRVPSLRKLRGKGHPKGGHRPAPKVCRRSRRSASTEGTRPGPAVRMRTCSHRSASGTAPSTGCAPTASTPARSVSPPCPAYPLPPTGGLGLGVDRLLCSSPADGPRDAAVPSVAPPPAPRAGPSGCFRAAAPVSLWCVGRAVGD